MQNEIMVSVCCLVYNHEIYIREALDSILMQKTNFSFEVLINDDASTDGTPEILKQYESKYPHIIKPVYQTENQYSQGVSVGRFNRERAKGKYIAYCEGDDFWTDADKLQKQVDYMEKHPECSLCVHAAYRVSPDSKKEKTHVRPNKGNKLFTTEEVIEGGGGLFATNSILYPAEFSQYRPDFCTNSPAGDYPLAIYLALQGTVYYMDEFMSAYRVNVEGSWTNRTFATVESRAELFRKIDNMLDEVNIFTNNKYNDAIIRTKKYNQFICMLDKGMFKEAKKDFKEIYSKLSVLKKTKILIKQYCPRVAKLLIRMKRN